MWSRIAEDADHKAGTKSIKATAISATEFGMEISLAAPVKFDELLRIYAKSEVKGKLKIQSFAAKKSGLIEVPISTSWQEYKLRPDQFKFTEPVLVETVHVFGPRGIKTIWIDGLSIK